MNSDENAVNPRKAIVDFCVYALVRCFVAFIQTLPRDMTDCLCRILAKLFSRIVGVRRKTFDENVQRIFPDATQDQRLALSEAMWHHLMLMVCEIAIAPRRLHLTNWTQHFRIRDHRVMLTHLLSGRPTILVTGHYGNFEVCGYMVGLMGFPTVTIARRLDNGFLHNYLEDFRSMQGQFMVDKEGCAPLIDQHLSANGTLSLLADQHAGDKGCWVDFLGAEASCHKALALFSLTSNAPMIVGYTRRLRHPMQFESGSVAVADPLHDPEGVCSGVRSLTQWYSDRLGDAIEQGVEQYWWIHRRWRYKPAKARDRIARAA